MQARPGKRSRPTAPPVDEISDEKLVRLFAQPRSPKRMLAGLRVLGFSADSVQQMTRAKSRDVVYSWAAGRARPGMVQAERLDEIRRIVLFICRHEELGAESAWMLFNAKFGEMDEDGPTVMELIRQGDAAGVMDNLEALVDDDPGGDGGEPPPGDDPPSDSPAGSEGRQAVKSGG